MEHEEFKWKKHVVSFHWGRNALAVYRKTQRVQVTQDTVDAEGNREMHCNNSHRVPRSEQGNAGLHARSWESSVISGRARLLCFSLSSA